MVIRIDHVQAAIRSDGDIARALELAGKAAGSAKHLVCVEHGM